MVVRGHPSQTPGENLAVFCDKLLQEVGILPVDGVESNVNAPTRHGTVGSAESGTTGGSFGLHINLGFLCLYRVSR